MIIAILAFMLFTGTASVYLAIMFARDGIMEQVEYKLNDYLKFLLVLGLLGFSIIIWLPIVILFFALNALS
jgi:hypothetical protein